MHIGDMPFHVVVPFEFLLADAALKFRLYAALLYQVSRQRPLVFKYFAALWAEDRMVARI